MIHFVVHDERNSVGVIHKGGVPSGPGLWFMDSFSAAAEMVTLCAASGFVAQPYPTGQGYVISNSARAS